MDISPQVYSRTAATFIFLFLLSAFYPENAYSNKIHQFETTRLKSTAGTGVGSVLMEEATLLNPAPLAFFNTSSVYLQKSDMSIIEDDPSGFNIPESDLLGFIASDGNGNLSGSISYVKQQEFFNSRKQLAASTAKAIGKNSSAGLSYKYIQDDYSEDGYNYTKQKFKQFTAGFSHILSPSFMMGLVFIDPLRERPQDTKAIVGFQYVYENFVSVMLDAGADYYQNLSNTLVYRAAIQLKVMSDFYIRAGTFSDKGQAEKGNGAGIAWIQPKLAVEFAFKNSKILENTQLVQSSKDLKETSFSLSYRF